MTTFLATLQCNVLQAQLQQTRHEIRSDTNGALQTLVDCLQAAGTCVIKKMKNGGSGKVAKRFHKQCFDCRQLTRSKLRRYRRTKRYSDKVMYVEARKECCALLRLKRNSFKTEEKKKRYLDENVSKPKLFGQN